MPAPFRRPSSTSTCTASCAPCSPPASSTIPRQRFVVDPFAGFETARKIEEGGIVLLKNNTAVLPLDSAKVRTIAVIGAHSDVGMISGGGSAQVDPIGGNAIMPPGKGATHWLEQIWFPTSPLKAIQARARRKATVKYDPGTDPAAAAAAAKGADVAIVFGYQWESEGMDLPSLSLPNYKKNGQKDDPEVDQNAVIAAVAAANPHTIVVVESGSPVTMPWVDAPAAILEAWYSGSDGADALANILFGTVNPSGKLPNTFPKSEADLPRTHRHAAAARVGALRWAGSARAVGQGIAALPGCLRRRPQGRLQVV